jgi:DNA-binding CsgD family transcriptional regulator
MSKYINQNRITNREKEIILFLSQGYKTVEIAKILYIGYETVKTHRKNIIVKTGAKNTANLIRIAYENRLLDFSECNSQLKTA